jgi:hypothetical protein
MNFVVALDLEHTANVERMTVRHSTNPSNSQDAGRVDLVGRPYPHRHRCNQERHECEAECSVADSILSGNGYLSSCIKIYCKAHQVIGTSSVTYAFHSPVKAYLMIIGFHRSRGMSLVNGPLLRVCPCHSSLVNDGIAEVFARCSRTTVKKRYSPHCVMFSGPCLKVRWTCWRELNGSFLLMYTLKRAFHSQTLGHDWMTPFPNQNLDQTQDSALCLVRAINS